MRIGRFETRVRARIASRLDDAVRDYLRDGVLSNVDFAAPHGEPSLTAPNSVSWRIFKNPVSLFIGGVTAVLLEFAEPRVRTGVWDHSTFRVDPVTRMKRTGLAAMVTVYGARSVAERMIAGVNRMHGRVAGVTPDGTPYTATDPDLLAWVHATASFGFLEAYHTYVAPLSDADRDRFYAEGGAAAALYGVRERPQSVEEQRAYFAAMTPKLERSDIVFEFHDIMRRVSALPPPAQIAQRPLVRAAVDLLPADVRDILGLDASYGLRPLEGRLVRRMGKRADLIILPSSPPAMACARLGLPKDYLIRRH
ncbi:MAG: oxygenase MpaB family protein [Pseudomonadota bacterium]